MSYPPIFADISFLHEILIPLFIFNFLNEFETRPHIFWMGGHNGSAVATLTGGTGADTFVWERTDDADGGGAVITDFDRSEGDALAFQDGADRHDLSINGFYDGGINIETGTHFTAPAATGSPTATLTYQFLDVFSGVATVDGHVTQIRSGTTLAALSLANGSGTYSYSVGTTLGALTTGIFSNFFYFSGSTLFFHKVTDAGTFTSGMVGENDVFFFNFSVAQLSGITGVGTGAGEIDVTDIILF